MKKENTHLIIISAPSGAGKTTLCRKLLRDFDPLFLSISSTTRPPRGAEQNGVDYFFLTKKDFENQIRQNRFAEWALVHGNYYGTSKKVISEATHDKKAVLLDIDVQGAEKLRLTYPHQCYRIFIAPPHLEVLEERLRARGTDTDEMIQKRLDHAKVEMAAGKSFDAHIVNDSLDRAYSELQALVETQLALYFKKNNNG